MKKHFFIYGAIFLVALSCQAKKKKSEAKSKSITGNYELAGMFNGRQFEIIKLKNTKITIDENAHSISANVGCNSINGKMSVNEKELSVQNLMQTEMACDEPLNSIESNFIEDLRIINKFKYNKFGGILLLANDQVIIELKRKKKND